MSVEKVNITSKKFSLNSSDFLKALLVALLGALVTALIQFGQNLETIVATGALPTKTNLLQWASAALVSGIAYLVKNFLTPQKMVSVIKMVLVLLMVAGFSSCKTYYVVKEHSNFAIVKKPTTLNDTIAVEAKIWGMGDIASQVFPPGSKAGMALQNASKHCKLQLTNIPFYPNDTLGVRVTCHSLGDGVKYLIPKK